MPEFTLMQHQTEGVKFLESVDGIGALLWDPGVGKTGATLAWIDSLAARLGEVRVLVVAPLTAADTWVLQPPMFMDSVVKARMMQGTTVDILTKIKRSVNWGAVPDTAIRVNHVGPMINSRVTILSISAGAVSSFCDQRPKTVQMLRAIRAYKPHVIVVDESHIIKSATANISKAMYQIGQLAPHRIILTGTVNPLGPLDCYGQWRFLAPWTFSDDYDKPFTKKPLLMTRMQQASIKPWPWGRFKLRYTQPGGYKGKGIKDYINLTDLNNRVAERAHVVRKEDALDLPPVVDVDVHVTLSARERKAYDEMRLDLALMLDSGELLEAPNALAKMMKLRQITAGFVKDTETGDVHIVGESKRKAIVEVNCTTLAGEDRLVVFGYFTSECAMLADMIREAEPNTVVEVITGATKPDERLDIRQRFGDVSGNPERMILVAQQRTMSISVNELVTAKNGTYGSLSERRNDWVQSRGRLDRKGQTGSKTTFWNVYVPGTIDEIMLAGHKTKGDLEKALLDHIRATPR
jgi:hypothetical protein